MSGTDSLVFDGSEHSETSKIRARPPPSRRRDKPQLSCNTCRRRKLKCNREHPCSACSNRGLGRSCTYAAGAATVRNRQASRSPSSVQERIQHLETLVVDLMGRNDPKGSVQESPATNKSTSYKHALDSLPGTTPENRAGDASSPSDCGSMKLSNSGTSYVGSGHWAAVLDGILELKDRFEKDESDGPPRAPDPLYPESTGPQLLCGYHPYATKEEILSSIPARPVVDKLVSRFFNSFEMFPAIIHSGQFLKEYERFWENRSSTSVIWIGLLFTIICLGAQFQKFRANSNLQFLPATCTELDLHTMVETFRQRIVQCLILGKYTNGGPYVLETLVLYFTNEHFLSKDTELGVWILLGMIVQFALRMGYHRDPKHFTGMSFLTGEMRRRIWATIIQLDLAISIQMGLPRLVKQWQADTEEPHNLLDNDFDENTTETPKTRPETEYTPMLYWIARVRIMSTLGFISDFMADLRPYAYSEIMKADKRLEETRLSIPECLKWRSMTQWITDTPQIVMQKAYLQIIYYKAKLVLHRKYLIHSPMQSQYDYSRDACLDAGLKILEYQHMIDEETQPFGQWYEDRWKISSILNHVFLLATSILCFYLQYSHGRAKDSSESEKLENIQRTLRRSHNIWLRSSGTSKEAQKAAGALSVVLHNLEAANNASSMDLAPLVDENDPTSCFQDYLSGFDLPHPFFGQSVSANWATPTNESIESFLGSIPSPNFGLNAPDGMRTESSSQWPWN